VRVFTVSESRVQTSIELTEGQFPFLYFDRGAGGGTHFFAHHKVVVENTGGIALMDRVSVAEESPQRYWFMPEVEGDVSRALVLVRAGKNCRIKSYHKHAGIRILATDKIGYKMAMLVLVRGAEFTIHRPEHLFNGLALYTLTWDGEWLREHEAEDPEDSFHLKNLTYI
jgi:hypothetical protein